MPKFKMLKSNIDIMNLLLRVTFSKGLLVWKHKHCLSKFFIIMRKIIFLQGFCKGWYIHFQVISPEKLIIIAMESFTNTLMSYHDLVDSGWIGQYMTYQPHWITVLCIFFWQNQILRSHHHRQSLNSFSDPFSLKITRYISGQLYAEGSSCLNF